MTSLTDGGQLPTEFSGPTTSKPSPQDAAHIVILGASNVTLSFPRIVAETRRLFPGRIQIFAAHGHGRSYGTSSSAGFRKLPGLRTCGLWPALKTVREASPATPLFAIATDIGNDLLFGATPDRIDGWLGECLTPLSLAGARIIVGRLPLHSLKQLGRLRFGATRTLFFPQSPLTYDRMQRDAPNLDQRVAERAAALGAATFVPRPEWYGFDPIHILRHRREAAWREILNQWTAAETPETQPGVPPDRRHWLLTPYERSFFGWRQTRAQPALSWGDGCAIWLY